MPKYGFFRYGTSVYGNLLRETSQSQLFAQAINYGKVRVTIIAGPRVGSGYVLVRTKNGSAYDPSQGVVVASGVINGQEFSVIDGEINFEDDVTTNDVAVPTGSVFYTLFVIDETGKWIKDAATSLFSPKDKGTLTEFLKILPRVLTTSTGNPLDVPETTTDLAQFLGGISVTYDEFQTEIDALLPSASRRSSVLRGLHESLARSVGMPVEFTIGVGASARLFREAGFIYRQKGTLSGLVAYTEALTGWPTIAYDSPNMIRYLNDASFETGVGRWSPTGATLVSQLVGGQYTAPELPHDYFLSPFASDAIGLVTLTATSATLELPELASFGAATDFSTGRSMQARLSCIPVTAGDVYYMSAWVNPYSLASSGTLTFAVEWIDQQGDVLSTSTATAQNLASLSGWNRVLRDFTAPTRAAFAKLEIRITGSLNDKVGVDSIQFAKTNIHYHDPRTVTVACAPTRVNLLTDGSFTASSEWTAVAGTATRDTGGLFGTHCLSISGSTAFDVLSEAIPAREGLLLNFSAYLQGDEASIKVEYLDSAGELIDVTNPDAQVPNQYEGLLATTSTTEWQRFEVTALAPEGAEYVRVRISGNGSLRMDAALLERSESAKIYFDADTADQGGEDAVVAATDSEVTRFNLVSNPDFSVGTEGWQANGTGTAIARLSSGGLSEGACLEVTKAAVANSGVLGAATAVSRFPVTAGSSYTASAYVKVPTGQQQSALAIEVRFHTSATTGTVLNSSASSTVTVTDTSGWVRLSVTGIPASTATFGSVLIHQPSAGTAGQKFLVDAVQVEAGSGSGGYLVSGGYPRSNLIPNPSFENGATTGWSGVSATLASTATVAAYGTQALQVTRTAATAGATTLTGTSGIAVTPGRAYSASAYVRTAAATARNATASIFWYKANGTASATASTAGAAVSSTNSAWARVGVVGAIAPADAAYAALRVTWASTATGEVFYLDAALLEELPAVATYFDGSSTRSEWVGIANSSVSRTVLQHVYPMLYPSRLARLSRLKTTIPFYLPIGVSARILLWDSDDPIVTDNLPYGT